MTTEVKAGPRYRCKHEHWKIDNKNVGVCSECGEVRQFPFETRGVSVLIKAGGGSPEAKKQPLAYGNTNYTKKEKIDIVRQIKEKGVDHVAEETGVNSQTLRTWRRRYGERVGIIIEPKRKGPGRPPGSVKKPPTPAEVPSPDGFPPPFIIPPFKLHSEVKAKLSSLLELKQEQVLEGSPNAEGYIAALKWVLGESVAGS